MEPRASASGRNRRHRIIYCRLINHGLQCGLFSTAPTFPSHTAHPLRPILHVFSVTAPKANDARHIKHPQSHHRAKLARTVRISPSVQNCKLCSTPSRPIRCSLLPFPTFTRKLYTLFQTSSLSISDFRVFRVFRGHPSAHSSVLNPVPELHFPPVLNSRPKTCPRPLPTPMSRPLLVAALLTTAALTLPRGSSAAAPDFDHDIRPILAEHCLE